ncbi:MAG: DUF4249 family protein [candidate division KSB1 bacterium]|nr:DUF4249 family protein [candidate division KSB1 bacterium]
MKRLYINFASTVMICILACGDVPVNVDQDTYNPKIVVDGYLFAGKRPAGIRISRNYPLNREINMSDFILTNAAVSVTDLQTGEVYPLTFNPLAMSFQYDGTDCIVQSGQSYRLHVQARVDGQQLSASSVTHVPQTGFEIQESASNLEPRQYDSAVANSDRFQIAFNRSPSTGSYIASIVALDASVENFIEKNVLGLDKDELDDLSDTDEQQFFNYTKNQWQWHQTRVGNGKELSVLDIEWFSTWFYGKYQVILYAADQNFTDYLLTADNIQEIDGNLLEPRFHFKGDGIGVFGSAIGDTTEFEILR